MSRIGIEIQRKNSLIGLKVKDRFAYLNVIWELVKVYGACIDHWDEVDKGEDKAVCAWNLDMVLVYGKDQDIFLTTAVSVSAYAYKANVRQKRN